MRYFIIFPFFLASAFCYVAQQIHDDDSIDPYIFEDIINSTIEGLRPNIPDPLKIDSLTVSFPQEEGAVIIGDGSISNFALTGLQSFQLTALNMELIGLRLNLTLVFPVIDLTTDYSLNFTIAQLIPIYGQGLVSVRINRLELAISAPANLTGGLSLHDLVAQLHLDDATFDLHGLFNDEDLSEIISSILNDLAVTLIDENPVLITTIISPLLEGIINAILSSKPNTTTTAAPISTSIGFK